MVILRRAALLLGLAGCTFNPAIEVSKIVCVAGDDNTCPSGYTCTLTEASPEGLCCRGSKGFCTEEPPALAHIGGTGGEAASTGGSTGSDAGGGNGGGAAGADAASGGTGGVATGGAGGGTGGGGSQADAALPSDATDASPDLLAPDIGPSCVPACTLGAKRCGTGGGVRQCVLVAGCPAWGVETSCGTDGRRACAGSEPNARCECPTGPASCNDQAGAYCASATTLETCLADADGCIYKGPATTCPSGKPCTGNRPSASCSCGAPPAACMGTSGNLCTSGTTLITCASNSEGCPAVTAMKTCGPSETCQGSAGSAGCQCNAPPAACAGTGSGTVCSNNSVLACSTTANGCVTSSPVKSCPAGKPCAVMGGMADCRCGAVAPECGSGASGTVCSGNDVLSCGTNGDGCPTSAQVKACPAGKPCGVQGGVADCRCAPAAAECAGVNSGTVCQGTSTVLSCGTNSDGCSTSSVAKSCTGSKQCGGSPADCICVNEPTSTDCPAGMDGSRCVGNQVFTCGTTSDGCRTLTKTNCPASGACVGTLPSAMCVSETSYGNAADLGGAGTPHFANNFWGVKIQVTTKIWLKRFGLIAKNAPGHLRLVLYKDNGMAAMNSAPAQYVAGAFDYMVVAGAHEYAVNNVAGAPPTTPVILNPGSYWMLAVFEQDTLIVHSGGAQFARYKSLMAPVFWNNTPPDPFGASAVDDIATPANYYLVGLPQ